MIQHTSVFLEGMDMYVIFVELLIQEIKLESVEGIVRGVKDNRHALA